MAREKALPDRIQSQAGQDLDVQLMALTNVSRSREVLNVATIAVSPAVGSEHGLERCEGQRVATKIATKAVSKREYVCPFQEKLPFLREEQTETRDATLRVSKRTRDRLKMAAAVLGRPLYDVTNEVIETYLLKLKIPSAHATQRRIRVR